MTAIYIGMYVCKWYSFTVKSITERQVTTEVSVRFFISQIATVARLRFSLLTEISSSMGFLSDVTRVLGYENT